MWLKLSSFYQPTCSVFLGAPACSCIILHLVFGASFLSSCDKDERFFHCLQRGELNLEGPRLSHVVVKTLLRS